MNSKGIYDVGELIEFKSYIKGYPFPINNMFWSFKKCLKYFNYESHCENLLPRIRVIGFNITLFISYYCIRYITNKAIHT